MNLRKIFYATICAHLFACALNAQMLTSGATAINILAPKWKMGVSVDASGEYSAPADLSTKIDGDLAVYSASANVKFQGAYADKHFLTLFLNYTYSQYDFSSAASPFSSANGASALAFYTARISERWGAFAIASASIGSETGASIWGGRIQKAACLFKKRALLRGREKNAPERAFRKTDGAICFYSCIISPAYPHGTSTLPL